MSYNNPYYDGESYDYVGQPVPTGLIDLANQC